MKKVVSLILALVLTFSVATVAFAMSNLTNVCPDCGFQSDSIREFTEHRNEKGCKVCKYCGVAGLKDSDEIAYHEYECEYANIFCDYCGKTQASEKIFDGHIDACKAKYFYIPVGLIIVHVKNYIGKLDFTKMFNDGKSFFGYVINIGKDVAGAVK